MCQSSVYIIKDGKEELVLNDATIVKPCEGGTKVQGFFTRPSVIQAKIAIVDLLNHKIVLEPLSDEGTS